MTFKYLPWFVCISTSKWKQLQLFWIFMMQNKKYLTLKFIDDISTFYAFDTIYHQLRFQFSTCFLNRNSTLIHRLSQTMLYTEIQISLWEFGTRLWCKKSVKYRCYLTHFVTNYCPYCTDYWWMKIHDCIDINIIRFYLDSYLRRSNKGLKGVFFWYLVFT